MPTIDKNRSGSETSLFQYISSKTKCWVILKIMWFVKWMKMEQDSGAVPFAREVSRTRARLIVTSKANIFKPTHTLASFVPISFQPDVPCKGTQLLCTDKHLCLFQSMWSRPEWRLSLKSSPSVNMIWMGPNTGNVLFVESTWWKNVIWWDMWRAYIWWLTLTVVSFVLDLNSKPCARFKDTWTLCTNNLK